MSIITSTVNHTCLLQPCFIHRVKTLHVPVNQLIDYTYMDSECLAKSEELIHSIARTLTYDHERWRELLEPARDLIDILESSDYLSRSADVDLHIRITSSLQKLAYAEADTGGVHDTADWCLRQWLSLQQRRPESFEIARGELECSLHVEPN